MDYITYKQFKGKSISGEVNIPYGARKRRPRAFVEIANENGGNF